MARYTPEHKTVTRQRMIETAGRRFKADGIDGSGIATLVADAGLTNGAFYGHFASKDELVATTIAHELDTQLDRVRALPEGIGAVESFLREYLSPAHRDDLAGGCPSAALLDEVGRSTPAARAAYTEGSRSMVEELARRLDDVGAAEEGGPASAEATERAISLYALVVGSLQLARAVTDPELSDAVLAAAYANAMTIVGRRPAPATTPQESR